MIYKIEKNTCSADMAYIASICLCFCRMCHGLKVRIFVYCHLQGPPEQQWFTIPSGVLISTLRGFFLMRCAI